MELDNRIIKGKRPLNCIDVDQAKEFVGKPCLFSDNYRNYKDIKDYAENPQYTGILTIRSDKQADPFSDKQEYPFRNENDGYCYSLVLPLEWVKKPEKKYRPFTNEEFVKLFDLGKFRSIRLKDGLYERLERLIITDIYIQGDTLYVKLSNGDTGYNTLYFLNRCEYFNGEEWKPFGMEE